MSSAVETELDAETTPIASSSGTAPDTNGTAQPASFWDGLEQWRRYSKSVFDRLIPVVREGTQAWVKLGEKSCRLNAELFKAAVESTTTGSFADAAARTGEVWKETVEAVRETIEAVAHTGTHMVEALTSPAPASVPPEVADQATPNG